MRRKSALIELEPRLTRPLIKLSRRLWAEASQIGEVAKFADLIEPKEVKAFVEVLERICANIQPLPFNTKLSLMRDGAADWDPAEAAGFLVTGTLALGAMGALTGDPRDDLIDPLIQVAFGVDEESRGFRQLTLTGLGDWPPFPGDDFPLPPLGEECLRDMLEAVHNGVGYIGETLGIDAVMSVDANGITSLVPSEGSADEIVKIFGVFPMPQPADRRVLFPRAGGGELEAQVRRWTGTVIDVQITEPPGDGPVGFATGSLPGGGGATALVELGNILGACLGPRGNALGSKLNFAPPTSVMPPQQPVPILPGDVNIFHGGPVLISVSATEGAEFEEPLSVAGLNLRPGDTVYLDSTPCHTIFVSNTQLTFSPAALASGHKLLRIGRSYHRSNPLGFELRATISTQSINRVPPDTYVRLQGSGFGSEISATVDGAPAQMYVIDIHTIAVQVHRPARQPLLSDLRAETVRVEVFDRLASIGSVPVPVATFRIATFGDSVVWGQGLPPAQRFSMLVADAISARRSGRIAVFALDHCARSGAVIGLRGLGAPVPDPRVPRLPTNFGGECPDTNLSIRGQVAAWSTGSMWFGGPLNSQRNEIDLVILDGGANDVGIQNILDPRPDDTALARLTSIVCGSDMTVLLSEVLTTFPSARVIVTGYYPIVSMETNLDFLMPLLAGLGLLAGLVTGIASGAAAAFLPIPPVAFGPIASAVFHSWLLQRLAARSLLFATSANTALAEAVAVTRRIVPSRSVVLALPSFGPSNAIFARDPYLFGSTLPLGPEDPVAGARAIACMTTDFFTTMASIGHPNARGARAYADAITAVLPSIGL